MTKVFIDGGAGTTGLRIKERLSARGDVSLIVLGEAERKNLEAKRAAMDESDVTFLCLPDDAAREAAELAEGSGTVVIDTSCAHRTADGWTYGFPELANQKEKIALSKRIANPGCHASGFIALVAPLTEAGILKKDAPLSCFSLTGYSGGGKKMIARYEDPGNADAVRAPSMYALSQEHKHLPEMTKICSLGRAPVFCPIVSSYYAGMQVVVPVTPDVLDGGTEDIKDIYKSVYNGKVIRYAEDPSDGGFLSAGSFAGRDDMQITVCGTDERILLVARFDNLGKGASGAAIQNMNISLNLPEEKGLILPED